MGHPRRAAVLLFALALASMPAQAHESRMPSVLVGWVLHGDSPSSAKRSALPQGQAKSLKRFEKKLPAGAKETQIHDLPSGGKAFQADVPGRVPGSKATYEKQVDSKGKTLQYTKTTTDPKGKTVHVKDKLRGGETVKP